MKKQNKLKQEKEEEPNQISIEGVTIRSYEPLPLICSYIVGLLKNKEVKRYLELIKDKKLNKTPTYTE